MLNTKGEVQTDRKRIADVLANFYEQSHSCRHVGTTAPTADDLAMDVPLVTTAEIRKQLKTMELQELD